MAPSPVTGSVGPIFSATYSNVPVFEFNIENNHVMRRRHDDWINATHILKVADFDKPARTRILEREVQRGVHEKIQGGYGKYQGTWVPLDDGRRLAERNGVIDKLRPIFDYVPGDRSPPQAPKHTTAASNKPKVPKPAAARRAPKPQAVAALNHYDDEQYENISAQLNDDETPDNSTIVSESMIDEDDMAHRGQYSGSRKRKRHQVDVEVSQRDHEHRLYADALLDYFMLNDSNSSYSNLRPPTIPDSYEIDRAIDSQGHTALHWAAAMGETEIVKTLIHRGAAIDVGNMRGETPLIRAALFDNCFERNVMPKMVHLLRATITTSDRYGGTVFHHVARTAQSCHKTQRARHYLDVLLNKLDETTDQREFHHFLDSRDRQGDTAFHIAARFSKRCLRAFQSKGLADDIPNHAGETVIQIIRERTSNRSSGGPNLMASSSPLLPDSQMPNGHRHTNGATSRSSNDIFMLSGTTNHRNKYRTHTARSFSESFDNISSQARVMASSFETEIQEKDTDLSEATRLLNVVSSERQAIRSATYTLAAMDENEIDEKKSGTLQDELAFLQAEAETLTEKKQYNDLHALVRMEENKVLSNPHANTNGVSASSASEEEDLRAKIEAAKILASEQVRRRHLLAEIVRGKANEGMTSRGEQFMKLIADSMGVDEAEVPDLLPDVLEVLEDGKVDGAIVDGGAVDGMVE